LGENRNILTNFLEIAIRAAQIPQACLKIIRFPVYFCSMSFSLQRIFARYSGFLRTLKAVYVVNNWLNSAYLLRNKPLYRRFGLKKSVFSPIGYQDFSQHSQDIPWIDRPDALDQLERHPEFQTFSPDIQEKIRQFIREGYLVLEGFVAADEVEALNREVEALIREGKAGYNFTGRKIFNLFEHSALADARFFRRPELLRLLQFLLGRQVIPFQSLNFTLGSEQKPHSDLIHMTTEPPGYLIAAWYALEPCTAQNGPLVYYPGSHRLPFVSTADYPSGNGTFVLGADSNQRYEEKIAELIAAHGLQPRTFLANTGDVLVWHSNLIHGGSPIAGKTGEGQEPTRKSMVCHYFAEEVICYHEMLQRPAIIKTAATA
jgi:ectoine hydroxylase-related dioxygenase (phytanoyl-CoA dioxygenase family)